MPQDPLPESSPVNILVDLLLNFPEIYTITLNLPSATCSLSYMVRCKFGRKEQAAVEQQIRDNLETFYYLNRYEAKEQVRITWERYLDLTQLRIILSYDYLLSETVSLLNALLGDLFQSDLITENRTGRGSRRPVRESIGEPAPAPGTLSHRQSDQLIAFRDSGKVYVFDK